MKRESAPERQAEKPASAVPPATPSPQASVSFPIVGIGASAGGLEALEQFLGHVPAASGMAFVIVQHLDPTHKGIMPELLQRATGMTVIQVKDRTKVRPDCVYVIPPNKDMSILHGVLHLLEPAAPRGLRLPIDFFLRSLARGPAGAEHRRHPFGHGLRRHAWACGPSRRRAGVVLVQEPATAKFDGMPRSAIDAGLADIVAPVEELPGEDHRLSAAHSAPRQARTAPWKTRRRAPWRRLILLRAHTGPRLLALQEEHPLPPDRAAHGHPPD